jgi:hypothetical protein
LPGNSWSLLASPDIENRSTIAIYAESSTAVRLLGGKGKEFICNRLKLFKD